MNYSKLLQAILDARENAGVERANLEKRRSADRERLAAQKANLQLYTLDLSQTRSELFKLEGSQTDTAEKSAHIT